MRMKAALIVVAVALVITAANFCASLLLTRQSLTETMGKDITLALDIANDLVSTRISLYVAGAQTVAARLTNVETTAEMKDIMREQLAQYPDFMAFAVIGEDGVVAEYGDSPASVALFHSRYAQSASEGHAAISTTRYNEKTGKLVMYVWAPMGDNHILAATIPGMTFSELLKSYLLWNTGNIFLVDGEGTVIAHYMPETVTSRASFSEGSDDSDQDTKVFLDTMLSDSKGLGTYVHSNVEYQCAYARVVAQGSLDWRIGLSVPLQESPLARIQNSLFLMALLFFAVGICCAVMFSGTIAKPYNRVSEQNRRLSDLNEITKAQADKLQEAHERTKLMMDAMPISAMLCDKGGSIFDCNEEAIRVFGLRDKQELVNRFFDISPERQPNGKRSTTWAVELIEQAFKEGKLIFEWMHQLLDGTPVPCEMTLVRVLYDDEYIVAAYARDLREHKQMMAETMRLQAELEDALEAAQQANSAKTNFLASMSHEMRTPLNAVIGFSELILNSGEAHGELEDRLSKIHVSGMTLLGIVNDILDISKIESGKYELLPVEYNTASLINDVASLNVVRIGEKPLTFKLALDEGLPELLYGDDLRVRQIFNNLLSNAFKYTEEGVVEWNVSFERDGEDIWLVSEVKDTGIGIKPEDIEKLFVDYSQVDAHANRKVEGTGLGLVIMKRLLDMMDGSIKVASEYGKGTTFSVRLRQGFITDVPIGKEMAENLMSDRSAVATLVKSARIVHINLSYAHVLVVDDVQTNLDVAKGMMKPYDLQVYCATSGQQAIDMIRAESPRYDAVFMDHMMPGMDGIEAVRIIREEIGTDYAREVPIIALTANALTGNDKMFLENGFQAFIPKPIDIMLLDSVLRQWVRDKDREKEVLCEIEDDAGDAVAAGRPDFAGVAAGISGMDIEGVDISAGLERFGGDVDTYIKVLQSYAINTRPFIDDLKRHLAAGNLRDYAIAVHGVKGSSYGIIAMQVGKAAEELEGLSKAGELEKVQAKNDLFLEHLAALLDSIDAALAAWGQGNQKPTALAPDQALLDELRAAAGAYDVRRVDAALAALEAFDYGSGGDLVAWLRQQVDDMDYDGIASGKWPSE